MKCRIWFVVVCALTSGVLGCGEDEGDSSPTDTEQDRDAGDDESSDDDDTSDDDTGDDASDDDTGDDDASDDDTGDDDASDDDATPVVGDAMSLNGIVSVQPSESQAYPASGASVSATVDGEDGGDTTTDSDGRFNLDVPVTEGQTIVLTFLYDGAAPLFRTIVAGPASELNVSALLRETEELSCEGGTCALAGSRLEISGLGEDVTGSAQVFNPNTESDAFPGDFSDDEGNLLVSGVFASIEVTDASGDPMTELDEPARLRMQIPSDSFALIVDVDDTNDVIDVPLYAFDEVTGEWVRDGQGWLESAAGEPLAPSDLESIRDGSYEGALFAAGDVQHFSYWNVDWPIESHGCVSGRIATQDGEPATGATVSVFGLSYTGASRPQTVDAEGRFCVDVMRSEDAGEDVDQDGIEGESQSVGARVQSGGSLFTGGSHEMPVAAASCGGDCLDIGDIVLDDESQLHPSVCTLTGTVEQADGSPAVGAVVFASDYTLEQELLTSVCGEALTECDFVATTDADGRFTFRVAMLDVASLMAYWTESTDEVVRTRFGTATVQGCVDDDITLRMAEGYDQYVLTVSLMDDMIEWSPNLGVSMLLVTRADMLAWEVLSEDAEGFQGPVSYGSLPDGALQVFPTDGSAPEALTSGAQVQVIANGLSDGTIVTLGSGLLVVP